jgi:hypothetical protein
MCRSDTSLSRLLWHQEEIKTIVARFVFYKTRVNNTTRHRVINLVSAATLNEHSLMNSLVHNYKCNLSRGSRLVVQRLNSFLKLRDFFFND